MKKTYQWYFIGILVAASSACRTEQKPVSQPKVDVSALLNQMASVNSVDRYFVSVVGDQMETQSRTIRSGEDTSLTFTIPVGTNRQVKAMAMLNLEGSDFVSISSFSMLYGESEKFSTAKDETKTVDLMLNSGAPLTGNAFPFIAKFVDASGTGISGAKISFRRSSDGFKLGDFATTNASGIIYSRLVQFPWRVDVLVNTTVVATELDFTQSTLTGNHYKVTTNAAAQIPPSASIRMAVGVFGQSASSVASYSTSNFDTAISTRRDPFTNGSIPDLSGYATPSSSLSSIVFSGGALSPTFASGTTSYTTQIANTAPITVTPTAIDPGSTIEVSVNSGAFSNVTSGQASQAVTPTVGSNTFTIRVTAEGGSPQSTYTVTVDYSPCGAGYYAVGSTCTLVGLGYYSPAADNQRYACNAIPTNARYTAYNSSTANCAWACDDGYLSNGTACVSSPNSKSLACNSDEIAVGISGRSGSIIDRLGIRCAPFYNGQITGSARNGPDYGGNGGGNFTNIGEIDCPTDHYLSEVDGSYGVFNSVVRTGKLRYRCTSTADSSTSAWFPTAGYFGSTGGSGAFNFYCGSTVNPLGASINGIIIDKSTGNQYVGKILGITCQ